MVNHRLPRILLIYSLLTLLMVIIGSVSLFSIARSGTLQADFSNENVIVVPFEATYSSGDLGVCGVNYVLTSRDFDPVSWVFARVDGSLDDYSGVNATKLLRILLGDALNSAAIPYYMLSSGASVISGRPAVYAIISIPSNISTSSLDEILGGVVETVERSTGLNAFIVVQVTPEDLFGQLKPDQILEANKRLAEAMTSDKDLRSAISGIGEVVTVLLDNVDPRFLDGKLDVKIVVKDYSRFNKDNVAAIVKAIRGVIGCDVPLVLRIVEGYGGLIEDNSPANWPIILMVSAIFVAIMLVIVILLKRRLR